MEEPIDLDQQRSRHRSAAAVSAYFDLLMLDEGLYSEVILRVRARQGKLDAAGREQQATQAALLLAVVIEVAKERGAG